MGDMHDPIIAFEPDMGPMPMGIAQPGIDMGITIIMPMLQAPI